MVLARDPVCRSCSRVQATVADHIMPLRQGGGWSLRNGQGLCHACHNKKTGAERRAARLDEKQSGGGGSKFLEPRT